MRVFITGGTGLIGRHLIAELVRRRHEPVVLVRRASANGSAGEGGPSLFSAAAVETVTGDVRRVAAFRNALAGCQGVVHLAWTGGRDEAAVTEALLTAAAEAGVPHFLYVSCLGTGSPSPSSFMREKARIERVIAQNAVLRRTIVRCSVVFGPGDRFVTGLEARLRKAPFVPDPTGRRLRAQPLFAGDLAAALSNLLEDGAEGRHSTPSLRVVEAGGPDVLSFGDLLELIGAAMGRLIQRVPMPWPVGAAFFFGAPGFGSRHMHPAALPLLIAGEACDTASFMAETGLRALLPFGPGIRRYVPGF